MSASTSYVALVPGLRFGDRVLDVGDPVPVEAGRDYTRMVQRRQIGHEPADSIAPAAEPAGPASVLAGLAWEEVLNAAADAGVAVPPEVVDLRQHDITVEQFQAAVAARDQLPAELTEEELRAAAERLGLQVVAADYARNHEAGLVAIPDTLPGGREALLQLALSIPVRVQGSGSKGYIKESDLKEALEAERARRTECAVTPATATSEPATATEPAASSEPIEPAAP